jgi:hypothetical protein
MCLVLHTGFCKFLDNDTYKPINYSIFLNRIYARLKIYITGRVFKSAHQIQRHFFDKFIWFLWLVFAPYCQHIPENLCAMLIEPLPNSIFSSSPLAAPTLAA